MGLSGIWRLLLTSVWTFLSSARLRTCLLLIINDFSSASRPFFTPHSTAGMNYSLELTPPDKNIASGSEVQGARDLGVNNGDRSSLRAQFQSQLIQAQKRAYFGAGNRNLSASLPNAN